MKINTFLDLVRKCPDNMLYGKFCIGNNFTILVGLERLAIRSTLLQHPKFRVHTKENSNNYGLMLELKREGEDVSFLEESLKSEFRYPPEQQPRLEYVPGKVVVMYHKEAEGSALTGYGSDLKNKGKKHASYQRENYKSNLSLHTNQLKKINGISDRRAIAIVTEEICCMLRDKDIPFCLPHSIGKKEDCSRIVYFPDSVEEEMCRK